MIERTKHGGHITDVDGNIFKNEQDLNASINIMSIIKLKQYMDELQFN